MDVFGIIASLMCRPSFTTDKSISKLFLDGSSSQCVIGTMALGCFVLAGKYLLDHGRRDTRDWSSLLHTSGMHTVDTSAASNKTERAGQRQHCSNEINLLLHPRIEA